MARHGQKSLWRSALSKSLGHTLLSHGEMLSNDRNVDGGTETVAFLDWSFTMLYLGHNHIWIYIYIWCAGKSTKHSSKAENKRKKVVTGLKCTFLVPIFVQTNPSSR